MRGALELEPARISAWVLGLCAASAYAAGVLARLGVHRRIGDQLARAPDGHRVLTSVDSYYYASGVKRALSGALADYERVPDAADSALVALGTALGKLTGLECAEIAYFFAIFAGPLLLVSSFAWSSALRLPRLALLSALPVALGYSYLNRTSPGQFDTDLFAVAVPYLALAAATGSLVRANPTLATAAGLCAAAARYLHPGAERLLVVCSAAVLIYVLWKHRDRAGARLLLALAAGLVPLPVPARMALVLAVHVAISYAPLRERTLFRFAAFALLAAQLANAVLMDLSILGAASQPAGEALGFYDVRPEVAELRPISVSVMAERVSGGRFVFALSLLGVIGLTIARPALLVLAPLFLLGTWGACERGLRFTIYAVPLASLGLAWLACRTIDLGRRYFRDPWLSAAVTLCALAAIATPAALHASRFRVQGTYSATELALISELAERAQPGDYAIAWWDYAYALWFYAEVRTLVDGMKQDEDLFVVAETLFGDSQLRAARLSRLAVEKQAQPDATWVDRRGPAIRALFADAERDGASPEQLLDTLANERVALPARTREIYLFLPARVATMARSWANARAIEGVKSRGPSAVGYLDLGHARADPAAPIELLSGRMLDLKRWQVIGAQPPRGQIGSSIEVRTPPVGRRSTETTTRHPNGALHTFHFVEGGVVAVVDELMLRSVYVQLAFWDRPDPRAFVPEASVTSGRLFRVVP